MEVLSTRVECEQASVSKQGRSPLQEIQAHTKEDYNDGPAQSGSVITLAESPTMAAPCSSLRCLQDGVCDVSSAQKRGCGAEEHWTPLTSTVSDSSEVSLFKRSINSHDTFMSILDKHRVVTPCNLFKQNNEDICVVTAVTPKNVPCCDVFVRDLTADFMACNEDILGNEDKCDIFKAEDRRLVASKQILNPLEVTSTEMQDAGIEMSILCLKCGACLLGALDHGNWRKVGMKKKFLNGLINPLAEHTDVLVLELPLLHPLIQSGTSTTNNLNQPSGSIWVEEDGCVFKPLFCPECNLKQCIGAYVLAANRMNLELVEMAMLLCDAVKVSGTKGGRCMGESKCCESLPTEGRCQVQPSNSFAKRAYQTETPPRPKLKLPRRD